jgi:hypothetical protein
MMKRELKQDTQGNLYHKPSAVPSVSSFPFEPRFPYVLPTPIRGLRSRSIVSSFGSENGLNERVRMMIKSLV